MHTVCLIPSKKSDILYNYKNNEKAPLWTQEEQFVFTHNQSFLPNHISPLHASLLIESQLYSIKPSTMLSTLQRRLPVSIRQGLGEENGVVTYSEHVQADLNGCWYSDFPEELLYGLCRCFRFQREAINAPPVDLIHMYGWLFRSVQLPPAWLSQGLTQPKLVPCPAEIGIEWRADRADKKKTSEGDFLQCDYSRNASRGRMPQRRTEDHKLGPLKCGTSLYWLLVHERLPRRPPQPHCTAITWSLFCRVSRSLCLSLSRPLFTLQSNWIWLVTCHGIGPITC